MLRMSSRVSAALVVLVGLSTSDAQIIRRLLTPPGYEQPRATYISEDGDHVVGEMRVSGTVDLRGFRARVAGQSNVAVVGVLDGPPGFAIHRPWGVSEDGSVILVNAIGGATGSTYLVHDDGSITYPFNDPNIGVHALSSNGKVLAGSTAGGPFTWSAETGFMMLAPPFNGDTGVAAISHNGRIAVGAGDLDTEDGTPPDPDSYVHACKWIDGGPSVLHTYFSGCSRVTADGSIITGYTYDGVNVPQPHRWGVNAGPLPLLPGTHGGYGGAISADGRVISGDYVRLLGGGAAEAGGVIWQDGAAPVELATYFTARGVGLAGWTLRSIADISMDGQVFIGFGTYLGLDATFVIDLRRDTDGDSLFDDWEINGIPYMNDDGVVKRYPLPGALPLRKDIFVEVDSMPGLMVPQAAVDRVRAAFDQAPVTVDAPGGLSGIALWVERDDQTIPARPFLLNRGWTEFHEEKSYFFGTQADTSHADYVQRLKARAKAYRYCMSVQSLPTASGYVLGRAELADGLPQGPRVGTNDMMLGLQNYPLPDGVSLEDTFACTFMHELGHTLGLFHGGGRRSQNFNPNHYSIMNYMWAGGRDFAGEGRFVLMDYSREAMPTLYKLSLDETAPVGSASTAPGIFPFFVRKPNGAPQCVLSTDPNPRGVCTHSISTDVCVNYASFQGVVDWNNDGFISADRLCADPNNGGFDTLEEFDMISVNEWALLAFNFRESDFFRDGALELGSPDCPTFADETFLSTITPAPVPPPCPAPPPVAGPPQPAQVPYCQPGGAKFKANPVMGEGPYKVQWRWFNEQQNQWVPFTNGTRTYGTQVEGSGSPTLRLVNANWLDFGSFRPRISYLLTDRCNQSVEGGEGELVFGVPQVTMATDRWSAACPGGSAGFAFDVSPPGDYTITWQATGISGFLQDGTMPHGTVVSGATTAALSFTNFNPADFPQEVIFLSCRVGTSCEQVGSDQFMFSPRGLLLFAPNDPDLPCAGGNASMTARAYGPGPHTFRWYRQGAPVVDDGRVSGSNTATLSFSPAVVTDGGFYTCTVTGACTTASTTPTPFWVGAPVVWPNPPATVTTCLNQRAFLSAEYAGSFPFTFQWMRDGVDLVEGELGRIYEVNQPDLQINNVQPSDLGARYTLRVQNACGTFVTQPVTLAAVSPPQIVQQPAWARSCQNATASLSVATTPNGREYVYWQMQDPANPGQWVWLTDGPSSMACATFTGVYASTLNIQWTPGACAALRTIRAVIYDDCNVFTNSEPVTVDDLAPSDFNGDGDIGTDADIEAFFACLGGTCCPTCGSVDYNGDGDIGTDADIESFFRVLGGGPC